MRRNLSLEFALALILALPAPAAAVRVSGLTARPFHGQTFLTWSSPPGTGWSYHVYRATTPPQGGGISHYALVGSVLDSTWCDRRCSSLIGYSYSYTMPDGSHLAAGQGLFVNTPGAAATAWYAVTCDSATVPADTVTVPGVNATASGVLEIPDRPQPVWQRKLTVARVTGDVYTLWTSDHDSPWFPEMCNRPSIPYDCAVVPGAPGGWQALMFYPHVRGGNFLSLTNGTGTPGEWVLTMDDYMPTAEGNTFWFGYNEGFDITARSNSTPTSGFVVDYTMRRVVFTLEWARSTLPIDTTRVYAIGYSMGAIGALFTTLRLPDLIAGAMFAHGVFDFGFEADPDAACSFNPSGAQRWSCDHLFGTVQEDLPTPEGERTFDVLDANYLVKELANAGRAVPPIVSFSGRYDTTTGWAEKPIFFRTMHSTREGGMFFFDTSTHNGGALSAWAPMGNFGYVYRYRSDRSFPALSNCSTDLNPGDGHAASGDSVGTINGYVEWDTTTIVDSRLVWGIRLTLRDLATRWGTLRAPDSLSVDVTPRRLQQFRIQPETPVQYSLTDAGGVLFASGAALSDAHGVVTIPAVTVRRSGTRLALWQLPNNSGVRAAAVDGVTLSGLVNPLHGACRFEVAWPRSGAGRVEVLDVSGRRVRRVWSGVASAGPQSERLDATGLASGVYLLCARQGSAVTTRRFVVVR